MCLEAILVEEIMAVCCHRLYDAGQTMMSGMSLALLGSAPLSAHR